MPTVSVAKGEPLPPTISANDVGQPGANRLPDEVKGLLAALGGLAVAVITLLAAFGAVSWSSTQTGLATAEAAACVGFVSACVAHFWPTTQKEPVAVAGTLTALVAATLALLGGFDVWTLTKNEIGALVGLVTALVAVVSSLFARSNVTAN